MLGRELQRLRMAHGLTISQLASMLKVTEDDINEWEAAESIPQARPISPQMRHQFIRQLALYRHTAELERPGKPRAIPAGFSASLVPSTIRVK